MSSAATISMLRVRQYLADDRLAEAGAYAAYHAASALDLHADYTRIGHHDLAAEELRHAREVLAVLDETPADARKALAAELDVEPVVTGPAPGGPDR